jgi:hypothetical protein
MSIDWRFLRFPFDDKEWTNKALIGIVLAVVGIILWPLLLPLWGYGLRIMRQTAKGEPPSLPAWDDWGQLFVDGLKFILVYLVYMLPILLICCCAYMAMLGPMALIPFAEDAPGLFSGGMAAGYVFSYPLIGIGMLLVLFLVFLALVAITRMVAHDSLGSAFQLGEVWRLARTGFGNYFMALVAFLGVSYIVGMIAMGLAYTIVLLCLLPFLIGILGWYSIVLLGALFGAAYHHSQVEQPAAE